MGKVSVDAYLYMEDRVSSLCVHGVLVLVGVESLADCILGLEEVQCGRGRRYSDLHRIS